MSAEEKEALFKNVRYYLIGKIDEKAEKLLIDGKAKKEDYLSGLATHVIVTDFSNLEVEEAKEVWQIPTVTVKWIELSHLCNKLLPVYAFTPLNSQLFSNITVCPSLLSKADRDLLWGLVTFYGGRCKLNLSKQCTHLVVPTPSGKKYEEAMKHPQSVTIVTPDWITHSIQEKCLKEAERYHPMLVILPKEDSPKEAATERQKAESEVIKEKLQNMTVSPAPSTGTILSRVNLSQASTVALPSHKAPAVTIPGKSASQAQQEITVASISHMPSSSAAVGMSGSPAIVHITQTALQPNKNQFQPMGQTIISQPGQMMIGQQQIYMQQQVPSPMGSQQFAMHRLVSPGGSARFSVPNVPPRFMSPNQGISNPRASSSPSPRKATRKRKSSSNRSKANSNATASSAVPSSPMQVNQMMSPQQIHNTMLQQNQQQMIINQQRMVMMQPNFIQQQMMQQQQIANIPMKGQQQVTPQSPQKMHAQHLMPTGADQTAPMTNIRPGFSVSFPANAMPMPQQQHQARPIQGQTQLSPQQLMAIGINPQMQQLQQQQVKMSMTSVAGQQQQQPAQFVSQQQGQGVVMPMQIQMQNQQIANTTKMQPQRIQMSPQQPQAMYIQGHVGKAGVDSMSPRQQLQQHSPMASQQMVQQHAMPQQQQQQLMMQRMIAQQQQQQLHMQQQQQLMQTPNNIQLQQKHNTPPNSQTPINVGIGVISPTALQQGLINMAQAQQNQGYQQPLIHPSLQTPQDYGKSSQQSGGSKSKRSKSRRTKDGDENSEVKAKPRARAKQKKSQTPASFTASPKKHTGSPGSSGPGGRNPFSPMMQGNVTVEYFNPTTMNVITPPPHPTVPVVFSTNKQVFHSPNIIDNRAIQSDMNQIMASASRMPAATPVSAPKVETHYLPQHVPTKTPPPPHRGVFHDPLEVVPKAYEGHYFGHDLAEKVPQDLCLLGCVFVLVEYQDTLPDTKIIGYWKTVINKFGGIVEDEYNTCTCTHLLCVSQTTTSFKDCLLEGKRCVTVYWLNDVLQIRELRPPWLALHLPTSYPINQKPAAKHNICYTGFYQKERERLKMMANICGAKFSGFLSKSNTVLICKGTISLKYDKAREWRIPCVNVQWLRDVMDGDTDALDNPNQQKYQNFDENALDLFNLNESKAQKLLDPWKVPVRVTFDCMQRARVKRKNSLTDATTSSPALKRSRTEGSYQPLPRVCLAGLPAKQVAELQKSLESLQGQVSTSVSLSTHLVAKSVSRTAKFLCAISVCQYIVTPDWIEKSTKSNWLLDEDKYLLYDKAAEEKYGFSLKESLSRAREKLLFKGYVFAITENVTPDKKILTEIVDCAGGKVIEKIPSILELKQLKSRAPPNNRLLIVSCPADEQQVITWKKEGIVVHNPEIILSGVLKQEIDETSYQL